MKREEKSSSEGKELKRKTRKTPVCAEPEREERETLRESERDRFEEARKGEREGRSCSRG